MGNNLILKQVLSNNGVIFIDTCSFLNKEIIWYLDQIYKIAIPKLHGWNVFVMSSVYNEIKKHESNPKISNDAKRAKGLLEKYYNLGLIQYVGPPNSFADRDILGEVIKYIGTRDILLITEDKGLTNDALHAGVTCIRQDHPIYTLSFQNGIKKSGGKSARINNGESMKNRSGQTNSTPKQSVKKEYNKPYVTNKQKTNTVKPQKNPCVKHEQSALTASIGVKKLIKRLYLPIPSSEVKNIINVLNYKDTCVSGKYNFSVERRPVGVVVKLSIKG